MPNDRQRSYSCLDFSKGGRRGGIERNRFDQTMVGQTQESKFKGREKESAANNAEPTDLRFVQKRLIRGQTDISNARNVRISYMEIGI